jgi:hypothetical protein
LTGVASDDSKAEYRFFKRDVLHKAIAEINACTHLEVRGPIEYKEQDNRTIADIQFEVWLKGSATDIERAKPLEHTVVDDLPIIGRAINAGVKQFEAEALIRKHGPETFAAAVAELENRMRMPSERVGLVHKPGGWLRAYMTKAVKTPSDQALETTPELTPEDLKKHRAAWTDEWLRRRKDRLRQGFQEIGEAAQQELLEAFRKELKDSSQSQLMKRFDSSGWQHRLVLSAFTKFYAVRVLGEDWDKPSADDILAIAAELANAKS